MYSRTSVYLVMLYYLIHIEGAVIYMSDTNDTQQRPFVGSSLPSRSDVMKLLDRQLVAVHHLLLGVC